MKINIMRAGLRGEKPWTEQIDAEPIGDVFAIHPTPPADLSDDFYNLTHVPTGYAFLSGVTEANAPRRRRFSRPAWIGPPLRRRRN